MTLFILRETWTEYYECPENGRTEICTTYNDIKISSNKEVLEDIAANLNRGHGEYWTVERADELRAIYPGYDDYIDPTFMVVDVSNLVI